MLNINFTTAVSGMLYYYGTIQLDEVLTIAAKCGLCTPSDYKLCMKEISSELIDNKKAYFYKNRLCHKLLGNAKIVDEMQEYSGMPNYKSFTLAEYIKAGGDHILRTPEMDKLIIYFAKISSKPSLYIENEVIHIWNELNNMCDLLTLTEETIYDLGLNYDKKDIKFFNVLSEINKVANAMPRWFCKGYTYLETVSCYTKYA